MSLVSERRFKQVKYKRQFGMDYGERGSHARRVYPTLPRKTRIIHNNNDKRVHNIPEENNVG